MDIVGIKRFLNKNKDKTLDEIISDTESVVNGIGNVIGNSGSPAGTDTLFGYFKRGFVKSVQRGTINPRLDVTESQSVTISKVNPSKSFVLLRSQLAFLDHASAAGAGDIAYLLSLSSNSLVVGLPNTSDIYSRTNCQISYEVVEFF